MIRLILTIILLLTLKVSFSFSAEWQWSAKISNMVSSETNESPRAFLWIPPNCMQVKAVIFSQHNMLEEGILEDSFFRSKMQELEIAEIWLSPGIDQLWDPENKVQVYFNRMIDTLAEISGYTELKYTPVIPIGHSAMATFPWNFAAQNLERTLAVLSIHGDSPSTNLTGCGQTNLDWSKLSIDGVPGLMVEGEYEWWEARVQPGLEFKKAHPQSCISFLCDAGRGHFDYSEQLINYLSLFIEKAMKYRLPQNTFIDKPIKLIPVNPTKGWLANRWHRDSLPEAPAAPFKLYKGNPENAFWYFDKDIAIETEKIYAKQRGKKEQYLGFVQSNVLLEFNPKLHARIIGQVSPIGKGQIFNLSSVYTDTLRKNISNYHSQAPISITRICGPVEKINDTTFSIKFYRMGLNNKKRTSDIWLIASSNGDKNYKSTVQQINIKFPFPLSEGQIQYLSFAPLPDIKIGTRSIMLNSFSSLKLPVSYYVLEGPAEVKGNQLIFTKVPPRAKYPIKITVVAWQYGSLAEPKIQSAQPIVQSFYLKNLN